MHEFTIRLHSVREVEDFVALATSRPYDVYLDDGQHRADGKSFMELFCLVLTRPLKVISCCDDAAFDQFLQDAQRFLIN